MLPIQYITTAMLVLLALLSDIKTYKIKNAILFPFFIWGLILNFLFDGFQGILSSLTAVITPIVLLLPLFALRMLGAGDIKLLGVIGSILGLKFILYTTAYSFISGGVIAIVIMAVRKNGRQRLLYLFRYIKNCLLTFSFLPYTDFDNKTDSSKFRFSYAIACGTAIQYVMVFFVQ